MIFNSLTYLLFLCVVVVLFWVAPRNLKLSIVFVASIIFYGFWKIEFVALMLISALVDYTAALNISRSSVQRTRKFWLACSLFANLGLLFYFKYLLFFVENAVGLANMLGVSLSTPTISIILPLGISFYTFQTISYTIDVYRGFIKPERSFVRYGTYVTFFPQLIAGPILRAREVIPQLTKLSDWRWENIEAGLRRICYGLFLKVVLADNIAPLVNAGFDIPAQMLGGLDVLTLAFLFGFQIYFDFSAYSHIAIGSARLLGIKFPENFDFPYFSSSPKEFWQRWHISLSSWIRDYLYLPLAGEKVMDRSTGGLEKAVNTQTSTRRNRALFLTWFLMGLWHGANWTFALWGIYHATLIVLHRASLPIRRSLPLIFRTYAGWMLMLPLSMIAWIPFRAETVGDALVMAGKLLEPSSYLSLGLRENDYLIAACILVGHIIVYNFRIRSSIWVSRMVGIRSALDSAQIAVQVAAIFIFLRPINQFIYFQF